MSNNIAGRQAGLLCSALQNYLSMDFRIRIMPFLIKMSVLSCFWQYREAKKSWIWVEVELFAPKSDNRCHFWVVLGPQKTCTFYLILLGVPSSLILSVNNKRWFTTWRGLLNGQIDCAVVYVGRRAYLFLLGDK